MRYFGFFLIPVTFILSRWLRKPYPVAVVGQMKENRGVASQLLRAFFAVESKIHFGLGTSLLLIAKRVDASRS
jgi:hypothetical protein